MLWVSGCVCVIVSDIQSSAVVLYNNGVYCMCQAFSIRPGLHDAVFQRPATRKTYIIQVQTAHLLHLSTQPFSHAFNNFMYSLSFHFIIYLLV